jgi:nitrogen fixation NifU-like protein
MCTTDDRGDVPADLADDLEKLQVLSGVRQFPMRVKCATLAWHTMNAAMAGQVETSTE